MNELLKKIKTDLRLSMDGVVSKSMRDKGLDYKLNFGIKIVRLKELADRYESNSELAELLWSHETRELKILATLLYPVNEFEATTAEKWVLQIPNQEIREQVCMNLFQKLSFANQLVICWIESDNEEVRTTAYWLFARLLLIKSDQINSLNIAYISDKAISDLTGKSYFLKNAAQNALKFSGRNSIETAKDILMKIRDFEDSEEPEKKEIFDSLNFEFGE